MKPWSITIQSRRLRWSGHLLCLLAKALARKALKAFPNPVKNSPGRQKTMWVGQVVTEINS